MSNSAVLSSLHTVYTPKPPCCLDLFPFDHRYVAVGTYNLLSSEDAQSDQPSRQVRDGAVMLYKIANNTLSHVQTISLPFAILDIHWVTVDAETAVLGAASSTGSIALLKSQHSRDAAAPPPSLTWIQTLQVAADDEVITSFAWRPRDKGIVYSSADGSVTALPAVLSAGQLARSVASAGHAAPLELECADEGVEVAQHDAEAWVVALDAAGTGVWSGGDDAALSWQPLPRDEGGAAADDDEDARERYSWSSRRIHGAGVTAVCPLLPGVLLTGSYDDKLRVLSMPAAMPGRAGVLAEADLGGGVWRIYVIGGVPESVADGRKVRLLVCCMYAGARVVELEMHEGADWGVRVLASFTEHESMCYGGAVVLEDEAVVLTCSFYDRRLCLWRCNDGNDTATKIENEG